MFIIFSFFSVIDECVIYNLCNGAVASYQLEAINIEIKHNPNVKPNDVHVMAVKNKCIYLPFAYLISIALSQLLTFCKMSHYYSKLIFKIAGYSNSKELGYDAFNVLTLQNQLSVYAAAASRILNYACKTKIDLLVVLNI